MPCVVCIEAGRSQHVPSAAALLRSQGAEKLQDRKPSWSLLLLGLHTLQESCWTTRLDDLCQLQHIHMKPVWPQLATWQTGESLSVC